MKKASSSFRVLLLLCQLCFHCWKKEGPWAMSNNGLALQKEQGMLHYSASWRAYSVNYMLFFSLLYSASLTASFLEAASPVFFLFPQISLFSSSCDKGVTKQSASKWGRHGTREEMSSRLLMPQPNHESETHINPSFSWNECPHIYLGKYENVTLIAWCIFPWMDAQRSLFQFAWLPFH